MKYPASVFYHDDLIDILIPKDAKSLRGLGGVAVNEHVNTDDYYVVRTHKKSTLVIKEAYAGFSERAYFQIVNDTLCPSRDPDDFGPVVRRFPSLYKAFREQAKELHFLPLIEKQLDADVHAALTADIANMKHVTNLTHKRKKYIIREFPGAFQYMEQTTELAKYLIKTEQGSLRDIKAGLRSRAICDMAVKRDAYDIEYIDGPTEKQKLAAVRRDGRVLKLIRNPSIEVMVAAVNSHNTAWDFIKDEKVRRKIKKVKGLKRYR